jgi:hypothetical protein
MRAFEFIIEAAYDGIRDRLKRQYPVWAELVDSQVQWAKTTLVKPDRVTWWLKLIEKHIVEALKADPNAKFLGPELNGYRNALAHLMSIQYQPIQDYAFGTKPFHQIAADLHDLEVKYKNRATQDAPVALQSGDQVIKDFGNGYQWVFTDRAYCPDEGRSGRHCGNVVGHQKPDQRIVSLRKKGHVRATFILEPNGEFGEMKGVGNNKPGADLHPYIFWLLQQPFVKGIKGGGYAPGQNFSIADLTDAQQAQLRQLRPDMDIDSDLQRQVTAITYQNKSIIEEILRAIDEEFIEETGRSYFVKGSRDGNGDPEDFINYADIMAEYEDADDASQLYSFKDIPRLMNENLETRIDNYYNYDDEDRHSDEPPEEILRKMHGMIDLFTVTTNVDYQKRTGSWTLLRDEEPYKSGRFRF